MKENQTPSTPTLRNLKDRIQFVAVLTLFFPTLIDALGAGSEQMQSNSSILMWGIVITALIANYLIIEIMGADLKGWLIKWVNILLLINVAAFIPVLFVLAAVQKESISAFYIAPFSAGLIGTMTLPVLILILFVIDMAISRVGEFKELVTLVMRRKK